MSAPFVGQGRVELVERLSAEFERVCSSGLPSWWSLEANTGWGKTRIVQELYRRLAAAQTNPGYWPASILTPDEERVNIQRKRVHPPVVTVAADAAPVWFWWGISSLLRHRTPLNALAHELERFDERREATEQRFRKLSSTRPRVKEEVRPAPSRTGGGSAQRWSERGCVGGQHG